MLFDVLADAGVGDGLEAEVRADLIGLGFGGMMAYTEFEGDRLTHRLAGSGVPVANPIRLANSRELGEASAR